MNSNLVVWVVVLSSVIFYKIKDLSFIFGVFAKIIIMILRDAPLGLATIVTRSINSQRTDNKEIFVLIDKVTVFFSGPWFGLRSFFTSFCDSF